MSAERGLTVQLLGTPVITVDGEPLAVDTRKAVALLAYLALQPGPQSRERLAALLWPESDEEHARSALRRTLSTLNAALGGRWVAIQRDQVALEPAADFTLDVEEFRSAMLAGRAGDQTGFGRAIALYRGDLLAGFSLRDSIEFEEWVTPRAEDLRREYVAALEQCVVASCEAGRYDDAKQFAGKWLAADPLNESAFRWLMRVAAWGGDRSGALIHYRECVRVLEAELGVPPLEETTELYLAIRSGTLAPPDRTHAPTDNRRSSSSVTPGAAAPGGPSPFVGRAQEMAQLRAVLAGGRDTGAAVLVEGEAGIGKTRLLDELAAPGDLVLLRARCHPGESTLPYGPVRELVEAAVSASRDVRLEARAEAARLVPALAGSESSHVLPPVDSVGAQIRFFAGVAEVLASAGPPDRRPVVVIDDAHAMDSASAQLLGYLLHRLDTYPVSVVFSLRVEEAAPAVLDLLRDVQPIWSARVTLDRLDFEDVAEWVGETLQSAATHEIAGRIWSESEGLPLLVSEYLAALQTGDAGGEAWPVPGAAREVLESRLLAVGDLERQVLATSAAIGRPFTFAPVHDASGRTEEEVLVALEHLLARRLLVERSGTDGGPEWEFTHEKLRRLAYDSMTATRRRVVHNRLAEALRTDGSAAEVAKHLALAGREREAAQQYAAAGKQARELFANQQALECFSAALALGYPETAEVHRALGDLLLLTGEFEGALRSYETAAAHSTGVDLRLLEHTLGRVYGRLGDFEQARARFEAALADPGGLAGEPASLVLSDWSLLAYREDDRERARELARQAIAEAEGAGSRIGIARGRIALGIMARRDGDIRGACDQLEEAVHLADEAGTPELRASARNALALAWGELGDTRHAIEIAQSALALCEIQGDRHRAAAVHSNLADLHHLCGEEDEALRHLEASAAALGEIAVVAGTHRPEVWRIVDW